MNTDPVYIVDDDEDDNELIRDIWKELHYNNPLLFFRNGQAVLDHLQRGETPPFLILCDVNIPRLDGFALKEKLLEDASNNYKSIPFIFWSSLASDQQIKKAYDLAAHGFFIKGNTYTALKEEINTMMAYWYKSKAPEKATPE